MAKNRNKLKPYIPPILEAECNENNLPGFLRKALAKNKDNQEKHSIIETFPESPNNLKLNISSAICNNKFEQMRYEPIFDVTTTHTDFSDFRPIRSSLNHKSTSDFYSNKKLKNSQNFARKHNKSIIIKLIF